MSTDDPFIRHLRMGPVSHTKSESTGTSCTSCSVQGNGKRNIVQRNVAMHSHAQCEQAHDTVYRAACPSFVSHLMHHGPGSHYLIFNFTDIYNIQFSSSPAKLLCFSDHTGEGDDLFTCELSLCHKTQAVVYSVFQDKMHHAVCTIQHIIILTSYDICLL